MKRLLAAAAALVFLLAAPPPASADVSSSIVLGDRLITVSPSIIYEGGYTYVPMDTLISYMGFGQSYISTQQAIFTDNVSLTFFLEGPNAGLVVVNGSTVRNVRAFKANAAVYLPVEFLCGELGFAYRRMMPSNVLRVYRGDTTLTDEEIQASISSGEITPVDPPQPPEEDPVLVLDIYLAVKGIGGSTRDILGVLEEFGERAVFYATRDEILADPQLVRDIIVMGHSVGLFIPPPEDGEENRDITGELSLANDALQAITKLRATLVMPDNAALPEITPERHAALRDAGYRMWNYTAALPEDEDFPADRALSAVESHLAGSRASQVVLIGYHPDISELTASLLEFMQAREANILFIEDTLPLPG